MNKRANTEFSNAVKKTEGGLNKAIPLIKVIGQAMNFASGLGLIGFGSIIVLLTVTFLAPNDTEGIWQSLTAAPGLALLGAILLMAGSLLSWFNRPWK